MFALLANYTAKIKTLQQKLSTCLQNIYFQSLSVCWKGFSAGCQRRCWILIWMWGKINISCCLCRFSNTFTSSVFAYHVFTPALYCCTSVETLIFYSFVRRLEMQNRTWANIKENVKKRKTSVRQKAASFSFSNNHQLYIFALGNIKENAT